MFDKDAVFHYCTNDKTRPYPTLLCSCCKPNSTTLDERDFNAYEKVKQLQAENKKLKDLLERAKDKEDRVAERRKSWIIGFDTVD